jgi:hypothetical protein
VRVEHPVDLEEVAVRFLRPPNEVALGHDKVDATLFQHSVRTQEHRGLIALGVNREQIDVRDSVLGAEASTVSSRTLARSVEMTSDISVLRPFRWVVIIASPTVSPRAASTHSTPGTYAVFSWSAANVAGTGSNL